MVGILLFYWDGLFFRGYVSFREGNFVIKNSPKLSQQKHTEKFPSSLSSNIFAGGYVLDFRGLIFGPKKICLKKLDSTLARKIDAPMPNRKIHLTIYHVKVFFWSLRVLLVHFFWCIYLEDWFAQPGWEFIAPTKGRGWRGIVENGCISNVSFVRFG